MKLITCSALLLCLYGCASSKEDTVQITYPTPAPDSTALVFMPGMVSKDGLDFNAAFSGDGQAFYFSRSRNRKYVIYQSLYEGNKWQEPVVSELFDTLYSNTDPFIAADSAMYFISNRPVNKSDTTDDYNIYRMARQGNAYAPPEYITAINSDSTEYYVSVSRAGNIYFASYRDGNLDLFMSKRAPNGYEPPVHLDVMNSSYEEHDPLIAPDESYLVFTSTRPGGLGEADLYISRQVNGQWQSPVNMGSRINTKTYEYCPNLSPDGKYFFYSSELDVKWISSSILN